MNNACPECGAIYAVAEKDIGRRIACKKCNSALLVAEEGLVREEASDEPRREEEDRPRERGRDRDRDEDRGSRRRRDRDEDDDRPRKPRGPGAGEIMNKLKGLGDVPTWLYGIGLVLVIYALFAPRMDAAKIASRDGDVTQAKIEDAADEREVQARNDGKPSDSDLEARKKRKKEFDKELPRLIERQGLADASEKQARYWTHIFRLLGFALLAFGSIGFMSPEQSPLKRILGGATILLILFQVIGGGVSIDAKMGG